MNTPDPKPKTAYRIFDQQGHEQDYGQMLQTLTSADVILFGELHDNPICHWLQRELAQDLLTEKKTDLILGAEMFEADDQIIIREYLKGLITEEHLKKKLKSGIITKLITNRSWIWPNSTN